MGRPRPWIPALGEAPQDLPGRPGELGPRPIWPGLQVSARHRILDLRLSPRDEAETKKRLDFLWTFVWNVEDYDCWTKEDRAYFEARDLTTYQLLRHSRAAGRAAAFGAGWRCAAGRG